MKTLVPDSQVLSHRTLLSPHPEDNSPTAESWESMFFLLHGQLIRMMVSDPRRTSQLGEGNLLPPRHDVYK